MQPEADPGPQPRSISQYFPGGDANQGTVRILAVVVVFIVVFGTIFWAAGI